MGVSAGPHLLARHGYDDMHLPLHLTAQVAGRRCTATKYASGARPALGGRPLERPPVLLLLTTDAHARASVSRAAEPSLAHHELVDEACEAVIAVLCDWAARLIAEPRDCVLTLAAEDVTTVQHAIVVAEKHVARLHRHAHDVLLARLVDLR